jgi:hypothetical protein
MPFRHFLELPFRRFILVISLDEPKTRIVTPVVRTDDGSGFFVSNSLLCDNNRLTQMKGLCRIFSSLLAVCVVLANVASVSPSFHVWWDHGHASATTIHRHDDSGKVASNHRHPRNLQPAHVPIRISLQDLTNSSPVAPKDAPAPDHRHNTLSQLLVSGTIEQAILLFAPVFESATQTWLATVFSERMPATSCDIRTAPRGPPAVVSFA